MEKSDILKQWKKDNETRNGHSSQQREAKAKIDLELNTLKQILSNSKPLEEELSKAIESSIQSFESNAYEMPELIEEIRQDYINNLKLDI